MNQLKNFFFLLMSAIGGDRFFRYLNNDKVLIVMYHGVIHSPMPLTCWWQLPYKKFEWQIKFLKKYYTILPLREVADKLRRNEKLPDNVAVVTFDDGYRNNYTVAYPLLKKLGIPATIFLATDFIGDNRLLWPDELYLILYGTNKSRLDLKAFGLGVFDLSTFDKKRYAVDQIGEYLKELELEDKYRIVEAIKSALGEASSFNRDNFQMLTWSEVRTISEEGLVDFSAHSCSHEILSKLSDAKLEHEIVQSCREVKNSKIMFAYTNGRRKDFDERAKDILASIHALCAVTTVSGLNSRLEDLYELKRVSIGDDISNTTFKLLCSGLIDFFKIGTYTGGLNSAIEVPLQKPSIVLLTDCLVHLAGGAEKQIFELVKGLDKNKYNVFVVSLESYGKAPRHLIEAVGCQLFVFHVVRIYGITGLIQGIKFLRFLKTKKVDVLQTYHFSSDIWGPFWGKLAGVPIIMSNRRDMGFWRSGHHVATYRLVNRWVTKVIVNASAMRDLVVKSEKMPYNKIDVIYNGVDLPDPKTLRSPAEARAELSIPEHDIVLMHVANIKPIKGHSYLLTAFKDVLSHHPSAILYLIGEDTMNGAIASLAKDLGVTERVVFLGKRKDVRSLLPAADICLLPSLSEGMSNAILEYMAAGKAVIATNVGGNPELVDDGFNGILVDKEDPHQLRNAILKLIENKELQRNMGNNGRQKARTQFSMRAMVDRYENLYASLLSDSA